MTPVTPFPLLKLSSLAIAEVLTGIDHFEIIQLLFASKRTRSLVEFLDKRRKSPRNDYELKVGFYYPFEHFEMQLFNGKSLLSRIKFKENEHLELLKDTQLPLIELDGILVPVKINQYKHSITTYYGCHTTEVKTFLRYFCRMFKPVVSINFRDKDELFVLEILDVLKKENAKLDTLSSDVDSPSNDLYQNLLELPNQKLHISSSPDSKFQYKPSEQPMKFTELNISDARWVFDLKDFLHCKGIYLRNANLKYGGLTNFIKKWMESDFPLEYAQVSSNFYFHLDLKTVLTGIPVTPMNAARTYHGYTFSFEDGKCYRLQRNNGKNLIIYQMDNSSFIIQTESYKRNLFSNSILPCF